MNKMCRIAEIYGIEGKSDKAEETYIQAEKVLRGEGEVASDYLAKVYTEHLTYLYNTYTTKDGNDITKWPRQDAAKMISVYNEGSAVEGISKMSNWIKRVPDMETLKSQFGNSEGGAE